MPLAVRNKLTLLAVFYKSTLLLSVSVSSILAMLRMFNVADMLLVFGFCFLSGGTVITLLHKEGYRKHEYYFYYNMGISRPLLMITCIIGNLGIGTILILLSNYAR